MKCRLRRWMQSAQSDCVGMTTGRAPSEPLALPAHCAGAVPGGWAVSWAQHTGRARHVVAARALLRVLRGVSFSSGRSAASERFILDTKVGLDPGTAASRVPRCGGQTRQSRQRAQRESDPNVSGEAEVSAPSAASRDAMKALGRLRCRRPRQNCWSKRRKESRANVRSSTPPRNLLPGAQQGTNETQSKTHPVSPRPLGISQAPGRETLQKTKL